MAGEEADESSYKAVALCADVEVAEREGAIAVVDVVVEDVEVEVEVATYEATSARGGAKDGGAKEKTP